MSRSRNSGECNVVALFFWFVLLFCLFCYGFLGILAPLGIVISAAFLIVFHFMGKRPQPRVSDWEPTAVSARHRSLPHSPTAFDGIPSNGVAARQNQRRKPEQSVSDVVEALRDIDWFQFEKFCAALLESEGYSVERRGGAHADGGVDLIARKNGKTWLIQCKCWKTWKIKPSTVRELLGSMTALAVSGGAIYSLNGGTSAAAEAARPHNIGLANAARLAERALQSLTPSDLEDLLDSRTHQCPKCGRDMVLREGDFDPFWGCSRYPRCKGKILIHK